MRVPGWMCSMNQRTLRIMVVNNSNNQQRNLRVVVSQRANLLVKRNLRLNCNREVRQVSRQTKWRRY